MNKPKENQMRLVINCGEEGDMDVETAYHFADDFDKETASFCIDLLAGLNFYLRHHPEVLGSVGAMHQMMIQVGKTLDEEGKIEWDDEILSPFEDSASVIPFKKLLH